MAKSIVLDDSILSQSMYGPGSTGSLKPPRKKAASKATRPTKGTGKRKDKGN